MTHLLRAQCVDAGLHVGTDQKVSPLMNDLVGGGQKALIGADVLRCDRGVPKASAADCKRQTSFDVAACIKEGQLDVDATTFAVYD